MFIAGIVLAIAGPFFFYFVFKRLPGTPGRDQRSRKTGRTNRRPAA
jgi:phosphotransferase system  glucose/maltose/N-acetylglucosamine-specific IIC component